MPDALTLSSIVITSAEIVEGRYDRIEGSYVTVSWGSPQRMLKISFDGPAEVMVFYISIDAAREVKSFQQTVDKAQRSFYFPLGDAPLDKLKIFGVILSPGSHLFPRRTIVAESGLIIDSLGAAPIAPDPVDEATSRVGGMSFGGGDSR